MLILNLDINSLENYVYEFTSKMKAQVERSVQLLAAQTHEYIRSKAQSELKTRKDMYLDALLPPEKVHSGIWAITLQKSGLWIEDGLKPYSLIDTMLKSPKAKTGKHGKYMVIPFTHADSGANIKTSNSLTTVLQNRAKAEMRRADIFMTKVTRDSNGSPIVGLVENIKKPSKQTQGMLDYIELNKHFYKKTNSPAKISSHLDDMKVYQDYKKDESGTPMMDKHGMPKFNKSAKTFRTVSESQRGTGLWDHPGLQKADFFKSARDWAETEWETTIKPDLINNLLSQR